MRRRNSLVKRIMSFCLSGAMLLTSSGVQVLAEEIYAENDAIEDSYVEEEPEAYTLEEPEPEEYYASVEEYYAPEEEYYAPEEEEYYAPEEEYYAPEEEEDIPDTEEYVPETETSAEETEATEETEVTEEESESESESETETEIAELAAAVKKVLSRKEDGSLSLSFELKVKNEAEKAQATDVDVKAIFMPALTYDYEAPHTDDLYLIDDLMNIPEGLDVNEFFEIQNQLPGQYSSAVMWIDQDLGAGETAKYVASFDVAEDVTTPEEMNIVFFYDGKLVGEDKTEFIGLENLEEEKNTQSEFVYEDDTMIVKATLSDPSILPAGASFVVTPVEVNEEDVELVRSQLGEDKVLYKYAAVDMHFEVDGKEVEVDGGEVTVSASFKKALKLEDVEAEDQEDDSEKPVFIDEEDLQYAVCHIDDHGDAPVVEVVTEDVDVTKNGAVKAAEFTVESFSTVPIVAFAAALTGEFPLEKKPEDVFPGTYSLVNFLNGYNFVAFGDLVLNKHCMGAVLVAGDLINQNDGISFADASNIPASFVKGNWILKNDARYAGRNPDNVGPLYLGTVNDAMAKRYLRDGNVERYIFTDANGTKLDRWGSKYSYYISDSFVNFERAKSAIAADMAILESRCIDNGDYKKENGAYQIPFGTSGTISGISMINLTGNEKAGTATVITVLDSGAVQLPDMRMNGGNISVDEVGGGSGIVWLFPNATSITGGGDIWVGHVVAPNANINLPSSNFNGCMIGNNITSTSEGHLYPYTGGQLIPTELDLKLQKTVNGKEPSEEERKKFKFHFEEYKNAVAGKPWEPVNKEKVDYLNGERAGSSVSEVNFGSIEYTFGNTLREDGIWYRIYEDDANVDGYILDDNVIYMNVVLGKKTVGADTQYYIKSKSYYTAKKGVEPISATGADKSKLKAITDDEAKFNNTKQDSKVEVELYGRKTMKGRDLNAGEFSFSLYELSESEASNISGIDFSTHTALQSGKTNDANGKFTFDKITYNNAGTYYYAIKEDVPTGDKKGVTYSSKVTVVTVRVTSNNGTLVADVTPSLGEHDLAYTFENSYSAQGSVKFKATKHLVGMNLKNQQFEFSILDDKNNEVVSSKNDANGDIVFPTINYSAAGTYKYKVKEKVPAESAKTAGMTYSDKEYNITVVVTDNGEGTLVPEVTIDGTRSTPVNGVYAIPDAVNYNDAFTGSGRASFVNTYNTTTDEVQFPGRKIMNGLALNAGDFTFRVTGPNNYNKTFSNNADGSITFEKFTYDLTTLMKDAAFVRDLSISYTYHVAEEVTARRDGMTYSDKEYDVKINVSYDRNTGKLTAVLDNPNIVAEFVNTYSTSDSITFDGKKKLNNRALTAGEFKFDVKLDGNVIATGTNDANGKITFVNAGTTDAFEYVINQSDLVKGSGYYDSRENAKYYVFSVSEEEGQENGITYDDRIFNKTLYAWYDAKTGTVNYEWDRDLNPNIEFENTYDTKADVHITGAKSYENRTLNAGAFEFEVRDASGKNVVQTYEADGTTPKTVITNDANGDIDFGYITYTLGDMKDAVNNEKTFTYTLVEKDKKEKGVTYADPVTITVTVVYDPETGLLTPTLNQNPNNIKFKNTYNVENSVSLGATKNLIGRTLKDDEFFFAVLDANGNAVAGKDNIPAKAKDGKNIDLGEFKYSLSDLAGVSYDADGVKTKTYNYTVKEIIPEDSKKLEGVSYTSGEYYITITVTYNKNSGEMTVVESDNAKNMVFTNTYDTYDTAELEVYKKLFGAVLEADAFTFKLEKDNNGTFVPVATGTNDADGNVTFTANGKPYEFKVTLADMADGTGYAPFRRFAYKVYEVEGTDPNMAYDTTEHIVYLDATYDASTGKLTAKFADGSAHVDFINTETTAARAVLKGTKSLTGRELNDKEFSFTAYKAAGSIADGFTKVDPEHPVATGTNMGGEITFSAIAYTLSDMTNDVEEFYYYIEENEDALTSRTLTGITYDPTVYVAKVTVRKSEDTQGKTSITVDDTVEYYMLADGATQWTTASGIAFNNSYDVSADAYLDGIKTLENLDLKAGDFEFEVYEADGKTKITTRDIDGTDITKITNDADGKIFFGKIASYKLSDLGEYEKLVFDVDGNTTKTYSYVVKEKSDFYRTDEVPEGTVTNDSVAVKDGIPVTVTVTYNKYSGEMSADVTEPAQENYPVRFVNSYNVEKAIDMTGTKSMIGRKLEDKEFTFEVKDESEEVVAIGKNDTDGNIIFYEPELKDGELVAYQFKVDLDDLSDVDYDGDIKTKEFVYTVTEVDEEEEDMVYDLVPRTETLVASYNKSTGELELDWADTSDELKFLNKYDKEVKCVLLGRKELTNRAIEDEMFKFDVSQNSQKQIPKKPGPDGTLVPNDPIYNDADGNIYFGYQAYTLKDIMDADGNILPPQEFVYIVSENESYRKDGVSYDGITYSKKYYEITVTLMYDKDAEELKCGISKIRENTRGSGQGLHEIFIRDIAKETQEQLEDPIAIDPIPGSVVDGRILFVNEYDVSAREHITGKKTSPQLDVQAGQYRFILTDNKTGEVFKTVDENGNTIDIITNDDDGIIDFGYFAYNLSAIYGELDEEGKVHYDYTVKEDQSVKPENVDKNGTLTMSKAEYKINVDLQYVTDSESSDYGKLLETITVDGGKDIEFVNTFDSEVHLPIKGFKNLTGRELKVGEFTVGLYERNEDGSIKNPEHIIKTATNGVVAEYEKAYGITEKPVDELSGYMDFTLEQMKDPDGNYATEKVFNYTINEIHEDKTGITYDPKGIPIDVKVTYDPVTGKMEAEYTNLTIYTEEGRKLIYYNSYNVEESVTIEGHKNLIGRQIKEGEQFKFNLYTKGGNYTWNQAISDDNGDFAFAPLTYSLKSGIMLPETEEEMKEAETNGGYAKTRYFEYYVVEEKGTNPSMEYDTERRNITVKVTYDYKTGEMTAAIVKDVKDPVIVTDPIEFTNTVEAEASVDLTGTKTLIGRQIKAADEFKFQIEEKQADGNYKVVRESKDIHHDINGDIDFGSLTYTLQKDMTDEDGNIMSSRQIEYRVTEIDTKENGITYSKEVRKVVVNLTYVAETDTFTAVKSETDSDELSFENTYDTHAEEELTAKKELIGRNLGRNEFEFGIYKVDKNNKATGNPIAKGTNDLEGNVKFYKLDSEGKATTDPYKFVVKLSDLPKNDDGDYVNTEFKYVVKEIVPEPKEDKMVYDEAERLVTLSTDYNKNFGELKLSWSDNAANIKFINTYNAVASVPFAGEKELNGRTLNAGEFSFAMYEAKADGNDYVKVDPENALQVVANGSDNKFAFTNRAYTLDSMKKADGTYETEKKYYYLIEEVDGTVENVTYDKTQYVVEVTVTYNKDAKNDNEKLIAAVTKRLVKKPGDTQWTTTSAVTYKFTNKFNASDSVKLEGRKVLNDLDIAAGDFAFEVYENNMTGTPLRTVYNKADGTIDFGTFTYDIASVGTPGTKRYTYFLKETTSFARSNAVKGKVTTDDNIITVVVAVTYKADGTFDADIESVTYNNPTAAHKTAEGKKELIFINNYTTKDEIGLTGKKTLPERAMKANEFTFYVEDEAKNVIAIGKNDAAENITFYEAAEDFEGNLVPSSKVFKISKELADLKDENYDESGNKTKDFVYTVYEVDPKLEGITPDPNKVNLTLTATYNKATGTFGLTWKNNCDTNVSFVNHYGTTAQVPVEATKKLTGRQLSAGEFTFAILDADGNTVRTATNNVEDKVVFNNLVYSSSDLDDVELKDGVKTKVIPYKVVEVKPDQPLKGVTYDTASFDIEVTVTYTPATGKLEAKRTDTVEAITFINDYTVEIQINKADATSHKEVAGAQIELLDKDGKTVDKWTSGDDGYKEDGVTPIAHVVKNIKPGETYTLREKAAPTGYLITSDTTFAVDADGKVMNGSTTTQTTDGVLLVEDDLTTVSIRKVEVGGTKEIKDAHIQIKDGDKIVASWISKDATSVVVDKKNYPSVEVAYDATTGNFVVKGLATDVTYTLKEVIAPAGYDIASDIEFTIAKDGTVKVDKKTVDNGLILIEDAPIGALEITKTVEGIENLSETQKNNIVFTITGPNNYSKTVKYSEFKDNKYTIEKLPLGKYTVSEDTEKAAIKDYTLSVEGIGLTADVTKGGTAKVTIKNTYTQDKGSLVIEKTTEGNTTPKDTIFTITGPGNFKTTVTYDKFTGGKYTLKDLPVGTYEVKESGAEIKNFTLVVTGNTTAQVTKNEEATITLKNTYTKEEGGLKVIKTTSGATTPDKTVFTVKDANGEEVAKKTYADFKGSGSFTVTGLVPGTYTVTESVDSAVVAGYTLEVTGNGKSAVIEKGTTPAVVEIINTYTRDRGELEITKTTSGATTPANTIFEITGPDYSKTVKYSEFTNGKYTIKDLPTGEYTVKEIEETAVVANYTLTVEGNGKATVAKNATAKVTIKNTYTQDKGSLVIEKTTEGNKTPDNTVFTITGPGNFKTTVTYGEFTDGKYTIKDLPVGTYEVKESGAEITNYTLVVTGNTTAQVTKNEAATITLKNTYTKDEGGLKVIKTTSGAVTPDNTVFTVKDANGKEVAKKTYAQFKATGSFTVGGLVPGEYTVTESVDSAAVAGYTLEVTGNNTTVAVPKSSTPVTVVIVNTYTQDKGSLVIEKTTDGNTTPKNAIFTIIGPDNFKTTVTYGEFTDGKYTLKDIPVGTYEVKESGAEIANYTLVVTGNTTAQVTKGKTATIALKNTYTKEEGGLKVIKTTSGAATPDNTVFTVKDANGKEVAKKTYAEFKASGSFTVSGLVPGAYTVTESVDSAVVAGYTLEVTGNNTTVAVPNSKTPVVVEIVNTYSRDRGNLEITKTTAGAVTPVNTEFVITGPDNYSKTVKYAEFTNGKYMITGLPTGEYTVTEKEGTAVVETFTLTVEGNGAKAAVAKNTTATVNIANTYTKDKGNLEITKSTTGAATPANTEFVITGPNGYAKTVKYSEFTNGKYVVTGLPVGEYTVTETVETAKVTNYTLTVEGNGATAAVAKNATAEVTIKNTYKQDKGSLVIEKTTEGNTTPKDTIFTITGPDNFKTTVTYGEFTDGKYTLKDLPVGTYEVKESGADVVNYTLVVTGDTTAAVTKDGISTITLKNTYTKDEGGLKVIKTTNGAKTPDKTVFTVTDAAGNKVAEKTYAEFKATGNFTVSGLTPGEYTVTESVDSAKVDGYILTVTGNNKTAAVAKNETAVVEIVNDYKVVKVSISKTDIGGKEIAGAVLKVVDEAGKTVAEFTTDGVNKHEIEGLKDGTYKLVEITAPSGYVKAEEVTFVIEDGKVKNSKDNTVTMVDDYSKVVISKTDIDGKEIAGAVLRITDVDGNRVTDVNGKVIEDIRTDGVNKHEIEGLKDGTYQLIEITAPNGYVKAETITFEIKDGKVAGREDNTVTMVDDYSKVVISKTDFGGKEIADAVLRITDVDGNKVTDVNGKVIEDIKTDGVNKHEIKGLKDGTYQLTEITAPDGYVKAETITFEIREGKVVGREDNTVTMVDDYSKVVISKTDVGGKEIADAVLRITDENGNKVKDVNGKEIEDIKTDGVNKHEIEGLKDGTYQLTEITVPDGYVKAETITFEIKDGKVVGREDNTVTMVDDYTKVVISKTDIAGKEIADAVLRITDVNGNKVTDVNGKVIEDIKTDGVNKHEIEGLKDGTYQLVEITAPDGYVKAETITFVIENGKVVNREDNTVTMVDDYSKVIISKTDIGGKEIPDAVLRITDKDGNPVKDVNGNTIEDIKTDGVNKHEIKGLKDGDYKLVEITAPDGYEVAEEIEFTIKDGKVVDHEDDIVVMIDDYTKFPLKLSGTKHYPDQKAGQFEFVLVETDKNGNVLPGGYTETVTNAADGSIVFADIIYTIKDLDVTHYYKISEVGGGEYKGLILYDDTVYSVEATLVKDDGEYDIVTDISSESEYYGSASDIFEDEIDFMNIPSKDMKTGELEITKKVVGADNKPVKVDATFYAGIFTDAACTKLAPLDIVDSNVVKLKLSNASEVSETIGVVLINKQPITLYVAEVTDATGTKLAKNAQTFGYTVSQDKTQVQVVHNAKAKVVITNKKPSTPPTPPSPNPPTPSKTTTVVKTGDNTPIVGWLATMIVAMMAGAGIVIKKRRS